MTRHITAMLAFVVGFVAHATTWYFNGGSDTINGGVTTPGKWVDENNTAATAFSVDDYYIVRRNYRLRIADKTFAGGIVQIGDQSLSGADRIGGIVHDNASKTTSFPNGANFDFGYYWFNLTTTDAQRDATLAGNITVRSLDEYPFVFYAPSVNRAIYITGSLSSQTPPSKSSGTATDVRFVVGPNTTDVRSNTCGKNFSLYIIGDASQYKGTVSVTSSQEVVRGEWATRLCVGDTTVGGKVEVASGAAIAAIKGVMNTGKYYPSTGTIASLKLSDEAVLQVRYDEELDKFGMLNVTDAFSAEGTVYVRLTAIPSAPNGREIAIISAPEGKIDASRFVHVFSDPNETSSDKTKLPIRTHFSVKSESGRDTLYLVIDPIAVLLSSDSNSRDNNGSASALFTPSSWDNAESWSDGTMPSNFSYWARLAIRTTGSNEDYVFPGQSFTLAENTMVLGGNRRLAFGLFYWVGGSFRVMNGHDPIVCGGKIITYSGNLHNLRCYNGSVLTLESEIEGGATLQVTDESGTGAPYGHVAFSGLNTNFTGKIWLDRTNYVPGNFVNQYMRVRVTDGRNLGGKLPEFTYDALKLRCHGGLVAKADLVLDGALNRGLFVDVAGAIHNGNYSIALGWPLTMNGLLMKNGAGTLVMDSSVSFIDESGALSDTPRANSNVFYVAEGKVQVKKYNAIDGLEVKFASATSLELAFDPEDENLTKYGILNGKTDTPFALDPGVSEIPLSLDISACGDMTELPKTFGVVTVKNTPATVNAVKAMLPRIRPFENVHHRLIERVNETEGTVTLALVVEHVGFRVILK